MFFSQTAPRKGEYYETDLAERDPDGGSNSFFQHRRGPGERFDYDDDLRRPTAGAHSSEESDGEQLTASTPSIGRRASRAIARFSIVLLIGVGATLAWQSYNGEAMELVRSWVPPLALLLPPSPPPAETPTNFGEQLRPMAVDLALVRRSVEQLALDQRQLAAKQENIAQDIATLQAFERDLRQNISSVPPPGAIQLPRHKPVSPPAQPQATQ